MATVAGDSGAGGAAGVERAAAGHSPLAAMRRQVLTVASLLAAAAAAWCSTADRMAGMDGAPGAGLGSLGWFTGVWTTMMAAMMLPSLAPAAAFVATTVRRRLGRVALFAGGYLMVWSAAGVAAYGLFGLGRTLLGGSLAWQSGGRTMTAGVLALAALYQLAPPKRAFLSRCRKPPQGLNGPRRRALTAGLHSGGWCLGSSWVLMAALFALGVMSLVWMALIALLVAAEKIGPAGRGARLTTAAVMSVLAISILAVPRAVPGFVIPGSQATGHAMRAMGWRGPPTGRRSPTSSLVALVTGSPESLRTGRAPVRLSA